MDNEKELKIKKKCQKDFPEFSEMAEAMSEDQLKKQLLTYANHREEVLLARDKDEQLKEAKEVAKELAAPYNESLAGIKTRTAYLHVLMEERKGLDQPLSAEVG